MFSNVPIERVFSMHDRESIYTIPDGHAPRRASTAQVLTMLNLHTPRRRGPRGSTRTGEKWQSYSSNKVTPKRKHAKRSRSASPASTPRCATRTPRSTRRIEHCAAHLLNAEIEMPSGST